MTAQELFSYQMDHLGYQFEKSVGDLPEDKWDFKSSPSVMSPREQLEHLCEAYQAYITAREGGKHEWGTYAIADKSKENLWKTFLSQRAKAVDAALKSQDIVAASEYTVTHDAYHVGQLCTIRLECEPGWDPYAVYKS